MACHHPSSSASSSYIFISKLPRIRTKLLERITSSRTNFPLLLTGTWTGYHNSSGRTRNTTNGHFFDLINGTCVRKRFSESPHLVRSSVSEIFDLVTLDLPFDSQNFTYECVSVSRQADYVLYYYYYWQYRPFVSSRSVEPV